MLRTVIEEIRSYPGITRKRSIYKITSVLQPAVDFGSTIADFGEDAAAISYDGKYLLLAADGIWPGLIQANPYAAGKASVMASINDIYAMGGRPLAMVNVMGIPEGIWYEEIVRGILKACAKYRVPMVGGHLHPDAHELSLSVSIMGVANSLLRSTNARPGQEILFAVDLEGKGYQCKPVISWDTNSGKSSDQVLRRLEVLPRIAEQGLCSTAKDISNGGLLGTIALLLETSEVGGVINLNSIPKPINFPFLDWLKAFLSYGFILSVEPSLTQRIILEFQSVGVTACAIGIITAERTMLLSYNGVTDILFDFERESITGIVKNDTLSSIV